MEFTKRIYPCTNYVVEVLSIETCLCAFIPGEGLVKINVDSR